VRSRAARAPRTTYHNSRRATLGYLRSYCTLLTPDPSSPCAATTRRLKGGPLNKMSLSCFFQEASSSPRNSCTRLRCQHLYCCTSESGVSICTFAPVIQVAGFCGATKTAARASGVSICSFVLGKRARIRTYVHVLYSNEVLSSP